MTAIDMLPAIGTKVLYRAGDLLISCTVADVKYSYGRPRLLIVPVAGCGQQWVELTSLDRSSERSELARRNGQV